MSIARTKITEACGSKVGNDDCDSPYGSKDERKVVKWIGGLRDGNFGK